MHYDVEGNLDINIKDFEEHIEQARKKLEEFEKNFKELTQIKSSNQMDTLIETVQKIREELKGASKDGQKLDEVFENTKQSAKSAASNVKDVNKEIDKLENNTKDLNKTIKDFSKTSSISYNDALRNFAEYNEQLNRTQNELDEVNAKIKENAKLYKEALQQHDRYQGELKAIEIRNKTDENGNLLFGTPYHEDVKQKYEYYKKLKEERKQELADNGKRLNQLKEENAEVEKLYKKWELIENILDEGINVNKTNESFKNFEKTIKTVENQISKLQTKLNVLEGLDSLTPSQQKLAGKLRAELEERKNYLYELNDIYNILGITAEEVEGKTQKATQKTKEEVKELKEEVSTLDDTFKRSKIDDKLNKTARNVKKELKIIDEELVALGDSMNLGDTTSKLESFNSSLNGASEVTNVSTKKISDSFVMMDKTVSSRISEINERTRELESQMEKSLNRMGRLANKASKAKREYWDYIPQQLYNYTPERNYNTTMRRLKQKADEFNKLQYKEIPEELGKYKEMKKELEELNAEKKKLYSDDSGVGKLVYELEEGVNKIKKLKSEMRKLLDTEINNFGETFAEAGLDRISGSETWKKTRDALTEVVMEFEETRSKVSNILGELEADYGITMDKISTITRDKLFINPSILTEGLSEAVQSITPYINQLENKIEKTRRKLNNRRELYEELSREQWFNARIFRSTLKKRKDGKYYNNKRTEKALGEVGYLSRQMERVLFDPNYQKHLTGVDSFKGSITSLKAELDLLEQKLEAVTKVKDKFFSANNMSMQGLKENISYLEARLEKIKTSMKQTSRSARSSRDRLIEAKDRGDEWDIEWNEGEIEEKIEKLKILREEFNKIKSEINELKEAEQILAEISIETSESMMYSFKNVVALSEGLSEKLNVAFRSLGEYGKWFGTPQINSSTTNQWVHEQLEVTRNFMRNIAQTINAESENIAAAMSRMFGGETDKAIAKGVEHLMNYEGVIKKTSASTNIWVHEQITQFNQFAKAVQKAHEPIQVLTTDFSKIKTSASTNIWIHEQITQFNQFVKAIQKLHQEVQIITTDFSKIKTSASTNIWVHEQITQFNEFASAVQKAHQPIEILTTDFSKLKTSASTNMWVNEQITQFNQFARAVQQSANEMGIFSAQYAKDMELATRSTYRLEESLTSMGAASEAAGSRVSTLGGILRTLRTTLSMIGGMFVWDFAFQILDATKATISAKSEMESFFTVLKWGAKDVANFNDMLDETIKLFPKMNKFQLGETVSSLALEFDLNAAEAKQIAKVAPMIVNEYLRAGRKTDEAILAIKDISQGEFLRLSRETGVGQKELKAAGWNGDNKDILNLYEALEKVGKSRHWDSFASKATSIDDVMLITENRMTEFATMISDWFTPIIVNSFNLLGSTFEGSRVWLENLSPLNQSIVSVTGAVVGLGTAAWGMQSKVVPAFKNIGSTILANALGVDKAIIQTYGLSSAIAQQTIVEKARNIALNEGNKILDLKITKGIAEAEASKLGMEATELKTVYERVYGETLAVTSKEMAINDAEMKARKLTQEALLLAEKESITVEEAHALIMERERIANMGALKSLIAYKLGLDMSIASQSGLATAIGVRIGVMEVEETTTGIVTTMNWGLLASYTALLVPLALVAAAVVLLVADFMDLCKSYDEFNDRLTNGQDKINELKKKYEGYHKTAEKVEQQQKQGKATQEELTKARNDEKWALINLEKAQNDYNKSLQVSNYWEKTSEDSSARRQEATKNRLKELALKQGLPETYYLKDYNDELSRAEQATYDATQDLGWRTEQFEKDIEKISDSKLVKKYKNAMDAYEEGKRKISAPDSSMTDRLFGHIDTWTIGLEIEAIKFENDPQQWLDEFLKNNESNFSGFSDLTQKMMWSGNNVVIMGIEQQLKKDLSKMWQNVTTDITSWGISTNQWLESLMPNITIDDFKLWFGTHIREPLQQLFNNPFGDGEGASASKTFDVSSLLKVSTEGIAKIGEDLWTALDQYLANHVPMYNWIKQIMPKSEATKQGQEAGGGLHEGFKTGIAPIDSLIRTAGDKWEALSHAGGQKAKRGVKTGSSGMKQPVSSEISDISSSLRGAGGSWFTLALNSAKQIVGGIVKGLNRKSPGDGAKTVLQEMIDAGSFITQQSNVLYAKSQQAGQSIVRGMQDMNLGQQLANTYNTMSGASNNVIGLNQATMNNTIGTYDYLNSKVNTTFGSIDDTITSTDDSINKSFDAMNVSATKSFTDMSLNTTTTMQNTATSNQLYLNTMQSSTLSTTKAMVSAWNSMKNNIVASAKYIQSTSYSRFASLHRSISSFYNQLANAHFSAGLPTGNSSLSRGRNLIIGRNRNTGGRIKSKHHGNVYGSKDTGLRQAHIDRIKNTSNSWDIGDPWFLGIRIPMNNKVKDFENGKTVRVNTGNFESILRDILTARGFANPGTYQYYANSRRSNQQVWNDVRCNCYDGAELIVEIGQMLGLSGHLVHGSWKGEGHMGAIVGGKLYDMTQFQKRGVFRGTSGVSFGTRGRGAARGSSEREVTKKVVTINVTNDLSNARIYGIDDLDNHIKETSEKTFYEMYSSDSAIGY